LVCIEEYTGFKYRSFEQQGGSGQTDSGIGGIEEKHRFGDDWGSMEFSWKRGNIREEQDQNKEFTKEEMTG